MIIDRNINNLKKCEANANRLETSKDKVDELAYLIIAS